MNDARLLTSFHLLIGLLLGLLGLRLLARLFAARPDNPLINALLQGTAPLIAPLAVLDAGLPRFGAVLEISTLVLIGLLLTLLVLPSLLLTAARTLPGRQDS